MPKKISLQTIVDEFHMEVVSGHDLDKIMVETSEINRPGLQLTGFFDHFNADRIQVVGHVEMTYLESMPSSERYERLENLFKFKFPCFIVARSSHVFDEMLENSEKYNVPILRTNEVTSNLVASLIRFLNLELAPSIIIKGVFMEVWGEGVLIIGEEGIGKSEMALELIKQNHRLIADENVEIRKVSDKTLVAQSPKQFEHMLHISGVGLVNVKQIYGAGVIKPRDNIDLVIEFEKWDKEKNYDRIGLEDFHKEIMGIEIPFLTVPVKPGRNLAVIVGTVAINNRLKKSGYYSARDFVNRVKNFGD